MATTFQADDGFQPFGPINLVTISQADGPRQFTVQNPMGAQVLRHPVYTIGTGLPALFTIQVNDNYPMVCINTEDYNRYESLTPLQPGPVTVTIQLLSSGSVQVALQMWNQDVTEGRFPRGVKQWNQYLRPNLVYVGTDQD